MKGLLLDNWTVERIVQCANDNSQDFSPELMALIESIVLWDDIYYFDNGYSNFWKNHSIIDGVDIIELLKPITLNDASFALQEAEIEFYDKFSSTYTSLVAKGALEYMKIAKGCDLSYMPFNERAAFIRTNNLFLTYRQYYDRHDAIHFIDQGIMNYYEDLNNSIRKADISFNPNILFSLINKQSNSFSQMLANARELSNNPCVKEFKKWVSNLENDISGFRNLNIKKYKNQIKEIEKGILENAQNSIFSVSVGLPCSISLSVNLPSNNINPHLLFPTSLYLEAISDDAIF